MTKLEKILSLIIIDITIYHPSGKIIIRREIKFFRIYSENEEKELQLQLVTDNPFRYT